MQFRLLSSLHLWFIQFLRDHICSFDLKYWYFAIFCVFNMALFMFRWSNKDGIFFTVFILQPSMEKLNMEAFPLLHFKLFDAFKNKPFFHHPSRMMKGTLSQNFSLVALVIFIFIYGHLRFQLFHFAKIPNLTKLQFWCIYFDAFSQDIAKI